MRLGAAGSWGQRAAGGGVRRLAAASAAVCGEWKGWLEVSNKRNDAVTHLRDLFIMNMAPRGW